MIGLASAAQAFLDLIVAAAAENDVSLPARRYIAAGAAGQEAWDCSQVTVAMVQVGGNLAVSQGDGTGRSGDQAAVPLPAATLRAEIVRPHPVMDDDVNPTAEMLNVAGVTAMTDAALLHVVRSRVMSGAALTGGTPGDVRLGPVTPSGPSGRYVGTTLTVAVTLW